VFAIIEAAGWPIWPLLLCSVIALAIIGERLWSLRANVVMPKSLLSQVVQDFRQNGVSAQTLTRLSEASPLGIVFAAGLRNARNAPAIMKEAIEESGRLGCSLRSYPGLAGRPPLHALGRATQPDPDKLPKRRGSGRGGPR